MRAEAPSIAEQIADEDAAYAFLEHLRWGDQPVCPHCGSERRPYFLKAQGAGRKTRTGTITQRRVWKCAGCRKQFSVLTGTLLHGTKIPVRNWLLAIHELLTTDDEPSVRQLAREHGLTPGAAHQMRGRFHVMTSDDEWVDVFDLLLLTDAR